MSPIVPHHTKVKGVNDNTHPYIRKNAKEIHALPWCFSRNDSGGRVNSPLDAYVPEKGLTPEQISVLKDLDDLNILDKNTVFGENRHYFFEPVSSFVSSHAKSSEYWQLIPVWEIIRDKYWQEVQPLVATLMTYPTAHAGRWSFGLRESRGEDKKLKEDTLKECYNRGVLDKIPNVEPEGYRLSLFYKRLMKDHAPASPSQGI